MRSCLRIVDAPSTPISSAIATRSAGVFFFSSFKCMWIVFSWGMVLELLKTGRKLRAAGRRGTGRNGGRRNGKLAGAARCWRYVRSATLSIGDGRRCAESLEWFDDNQHNDDCRGDSGDFVDHADGLARQRALAIGK